jgi:hypothetical protein
VEHGSPMLVDSSPFGWFIRILHFHPAGGVQKRLFASILSLRRIVRGRSSHPPNGRSQVRPAAAVYNAFESGAGSAVAMMTRMRCR